MKAYFVLKVFETLQKNNVNGYSSREKSSQIHEGAMFVGQNCEMIVIWKENGKQRQPMTVEHYAKAQRNNKCRLI